MNEDRIGQITLSFVVEIKLYIYVCVCDFYGDCIEILYGFLVS